MRIRISVGFWNTEDELERFAAVVELLAGHTPETIPPRRTLTVLGSDDQPARLRRRVPVDSGRAGIRGSKPAPHDVASSRFAGASSAARRARCSGRS